MNSPHEWKITLSHIIKYDGISNILLYDIYIDIKFYVFKKINNYRIKCYMQMILQYKI